MLTTSPAAGRTRAPAASPVPLWVMIAGGALLAAGILAIRGVPWQLLLLVAVAGAAILVALRERRRHRARAAAGIREALLPFTGPATRLRCRRWVRVGRRLLAPRYVRIQYGPEARDWDPKWLPQVITVVGARSGLEYKKLVHDQPRNCLVLIEKKSEKDEAASPRAELELRAGTTMTELLGKGVRARYEWVDNSLSAIDVRFENEVAVKLTSRMKRQQVERVVTAMLPGRWRAKWDIESSSAHFELRPVMPESVPHPTPVITDANRYLIPVGVTEDGDTIIWDLKSTDPHGLIIGPTGSGKTVQLLGIVAEWTRRDWRVWIADPKRIEFIGAEKWPNVQIVADTVESQMALIILAKEEMDRRYAAIRHGADERDFEPILLLLDEYSNLRSAINSWWTQNKPKGAPSKCPVFAMLGEIVRMARSARIHLLFGLQRPDAEILSGEVRDNLQFRLSLGRLSAQGATMMWGAPWIGTSVPRKIPGRGTGLDAEGSPVEAQFYWTPDPRRALRDRKEADLEILRGLLPSAVTHKRFEFQIEDEDSPTWIGEDGKSTYSTWAAILEASCRTTADADEVLDVDAIPDLTDQEDGGQDDTGETAETRPERHLQLVQDQAEDDAGGDEYGPVQAMSADRVQSGDLLLLDEEWVVVESAVADLEEDGMISISWRTDEDDAGELALDADDMLEVRRLADAGAGRADDENEEEDA